MTTFAQTAELLLVANRMTQRLLEPVNGQLSRANTRAALALLEDILQAQQHFDRAEYAEAERILEWANPEPEPREP